MDCTDYMNMVELDEENATQCVVFDKTPGAEQKKINIVVRSNYKVKKVFADISTQFHYDSFDLILQPQDLDLVFLNNCHTLLLYSIPGFIPSIRNVLILLPAGKWDGNVKQRFDVTMSKQLSLSAVINNTSYGINKSPNANVSNGNFVENNNSFCIEENSNLSLASITTVANSTNNSPTDSFNFSITSDQDQLSDDDLALGASASPTTIEPGLRENSLNINHSLSLSSPQYDSEGCANTNEIDERVSLTSNFDDKSDAFYLDKRYPTPVKPIPPPATSKNRTNKFVGLVNQAMTCYLNSLLQALYMTPEFRNALYRWEFDNDREQKNIPYQLQKLFLNLQTSQKSAVETTDLTRSFGWDSTEAWQQHDIQELCRVMFEALEHKFRNTQQANLIANLYEGKMIDYVKCLECNTEKTRADTFLDIPLPVRPFGSNVAYGSIEEALRAFVQPETLDGNNQYFCEKCNKKCDAHKGLKFKNFPYILTLHLKRFDFDYQTMHRIKLNDKVTFPANLNLNTFVSSMEKIGENSAQPNGHASATNTDDCSTTDSGSAMEEDSCSVGVTAPNSTNQHENDMNEDDEGIDMSTSTDHRISSSASIDQHLDQAPGPYLYELFAIMIHSGSASGGHYYAYIKQFETNEWYCFNDQLVSPITEAEIEKSFGGCLSKVYYSSAFSASTNAYMLMYRQVDAERNEKPMAIDQFPRHIQSLLPALQTAEEIRPTRSGRSNAASDLTLPGLIKPRVYFYNPRFRKVMNTRIFVSRSFDLKSALESAYDLLNVCEFAPISRCRLVAYDPTNEEIKQSFEWVNESTMSEFRSTLEGTVDFLLEYFSENQSSEQYKLNGFTWYVYMVNLNTMEMDGPFLVYSPSRENGDVLRHSIAVRLHLNEKQLLLATLSNRKAFVAYDPIPTKEAQDHLQAVANARFQSLTYFYVNVPATDSLNLEYAGVLPYKPQSPSIQLNSDVVDAVLLNESSQKLNVMNEPILTGNASFDNTQRESPLSANLHGQEPNSEDSSLSDGDRTLVECAPKIDSSDSQISSNCNSPQFSSPEDESSNDSLNHIESFLNGKSDYENESRSNNFEAPKFFHALRVDCADNESPRIIYQNTDDDIINKPVFTYKVLVDFRMKLHTFKRCLESLINVSVNCFKIHCKDDSPESLIPTSSLLIITEGETLSIKLGKVLQPDEYKAKIYFMRLSDFDNETPKLSAVCEWVFKLNSTVKEAKMELVKKLHRLDDVKYASLTLANCRLWAKGGSNPTKIYSDDETFTNEIRSKLPIELIVQECENGTSTQVSEDDIILFVRQWRPSNWELGPYQELHLNKNSEIRHELSKISDIPEKDVAYAKLFTSFPCNNISLLTLNATANWTSSPCTSSIFPLKNTCSGNVYLYKKNSEPIRELNPEDKRELTAKEKARLDRLGVSGSALVTPRRERGLKIYLDSPKPHATNGGANMDVSNCAGGAH